MSLATSCPACGTVFKVVEDQLKVSEGWVRCGHCHEVFNALEGLFDLEGRQRPTHGSAVDAPVKSRPLAKTPSGPAIPDPSRTAPPPRTPIVDEGRADWIETRPAMFSDVQALRQRQFERDAAQLKRLDRPAVAAPVRAGLSSSTPIDATRPEVLPPAPDPIATTDRPDPLEHGSQSIHASADDDVATFPPLDAPGDEETRGDVTPSAPAHAPAPAEASATADEDAPAAEAIDFSMADTVFLQHESSRLFDDLPADTPLMPPMHDEAWPDPRYAATVVAPMPEEAVASPIAVAAGTPATTTKPDFVRAADRAAWWRKPVVRSAVVVLCLVAGALLVFQFVLYQRDLLVARWPSLHPSLLATCNLLGCELRAPRQLDALAVENSSLTRPTGVDGYRLQVLIRNRADYPVLAPHLELSLSDGAGAVIVRRILAPADFRQTEQLAAGSEGNWQLELASSDKRISGFTVAAFYP